MKNIKKLDLNLLHVFDAIYSEGGITRAARRLHLTQPAVTHALNRLRQAFDDPLFVREGRRVVPSPTARNVARPIRNLLRDVEIMLADLNQFDPVTTPRRFTIGMRDVMEPTLLPHLQRSVWAVSHGISLESIQTDRKNVEAELASGRLDAVVDVDLPVSDAVRRQHLQFDRLVVVCRRGHPLLQQALDLDRYCAEQHILATVRRSGGGREDVALSRQGRSRHIQLRCQHYFAALEVVRQTDLILTLPEGYAEVANRQGELVTLPFPLDLDEAGGYLYWHSNVDQDQANVWLRQKIAAAFETTNEATR